MQASGILNPVIAVQRILRLVPGEPPLVGHLIAVSYTHLQDEVLIGVWGQRHRQYLKTHHHVRYYNLLTAGALNSYLTEIELQAQALFNDIVTVSYTHLDVYKRQLCCCALWVWAPASGSLTAWLCWPSRR